MKKWSPLIFGSCSSLDSTFLQGHWQMANIRMGVTRVVEPEGHDLWEKAGEWVMCNKGKLSVADHDSWLQASGGLWCGSGAPSPHFVPRAELRSVGRFQKGSSFLVNVGKNVLPVYLLLCDAVAPRKGSSKISKVSISHALGGGFCLDGKIEFLDL